LQSFYQTNSDQAYELYKITREFAGLTGNETVYDLYTGTGTIAQFVSKQAKKVIGVRALVEEIVVKFPNSWTKTDLEVANEVLEGLKNNWSIPNDKVTVKVESGWVTLEGELPWIYQREAAKNAVNYLTGVKGVTNNIKIKSETHDTIEKRDVEKAIGRSWSIDDSDIEVSVSGTTVTLTGTVNSWYQRDEAARIAWNTPGIWHVKNELTVDYEYAFS
jgi:osmotically-inducible protein OsmY